MLNFTYNGTEGPYTLSADGLTVYDATPQIFYLQQDPADPSGSFYVEIYGINFGQNTGTVAVCATGDNPCTSTPDVAVSNGPYPYWSDNQVNVLLTPTPTASGTYDVQITSRGEAGNGFQPAPQQRTTSFSNRWQVVVNPPAVTLTLNRQLLMEYLASGNPGGGSYSESVQSLAGGSPVGLAVNSTVTLQGIAIDFVDPPNPAGSGSPSPGGLAQISTLYIAPSGISALKDFLVPTFGVSCYYSALENEFRTAQGCSSVTIGGVTYSGFITNPPNVTGTFCSAFIGQVKLQGSGQAIDGRLIQYDVNTSTWRVVSQIQTSDGGFLNPGHTIARDRNIIPTGGVRVALDGIGEDLLANDSGKAINGYRIDLFNGYGHAVCANYNNPIVVGACSPGNVKCPGRTIQ
jgi:3D (Asp-Asp-Asp) domain-containing protein